MQEQESPPAQDGGPRRLRLLPRRKAAKVAPPVTPEEEVEPPPDPEPTDSAPAPSRSRRRREQRKRAAVKRATVEPSGNGASTEAPKVKPATKRAFGEAPPIESPPETPIKETPPPILEAPKPAATRRSSPRPRRAPTTKDAAKEKPPAVRPPFAHQTEADFARVLDFYGIEWQYEPRFFPLRWDEGRVAEGFTPDFYMPDFDLFVELTILRSGLRAEKDRKIRLLKEQHPEINIKLFHKAALLRFLTKYGYGPLAPDDMPEVSRVLITAKKLEERVAELGAQISRDFKDRDLVLIGVLRGAVCFLSDLIRQISIPLNVDFLAVSGYGDGSGGVKILKDIDENIKGRHVLLIEDIVDSGLTLDRIREYLETKKPASLQVCALLDKKPRRLTLVDLAYVGFDAPDEFLVGYGLDFRQRYRNLPFIAALKHELLP